MTSTSDLASGRSAIDPWLTAMGVRGNQGVVFAAGGASDVILARCIAGRAIALGASQVDIVEAMGRRTLSEIVAPEDRRQAFALEPLPHTDPEQVLRHFASITNPDGPIKIRGKGIRISAALTWNHGERLISAAVGEGMPTVVARPWAPGQPYAFAIGVDGGGDVLTHDEREFDRKVLAAFAGAWTDTESLALIVVGLGADGGSTPAEFVDAAPPGWLHHGTVDMDEALADAMQDGLEAANCWMHEPLTWRVDVLEWDYGLKVPQIIAMAIRRQFIFPSNDSEFVCFPRRKKLTPMSAQLLRQARIYFRAAGGA